MRSFVIATLCIVAVVVCSPAFAGASASATASASADAPAAVYAHPQASGPACASGGGGGVACATGNVDFETTTLRLGPLRRVMAGRREARETRQELKNTEFVLQRTNVQHTTGYFVTHAPVAYYAPAAYCAPVAPGRYGIDDTQ